MSTRRQPFCNPKIGGKIEKTTLLCTTKSNKLTRNLCKRPNARIAAEALKIKQRNYSELFSEIFEMILGAKFVIRRFYSATQSFQFDVSIKFFAVIGYVIMPSLCRIL